MDTNRFKFRAKRIDNNEFVYGFLCFIIRDVCRIYCNEEDKFYDCSTKTLGQCTGLKDKNGKFIYEGDIVFIECEEDNAEIKWEEDCAAFSILTKDTCWCFDSFYSYELEVIGNIHENKELLRSYKLWQIKKKELK